jgi:opacity protein-like surface antigen
VRLTIAFLLLTCATPLPAAAAQTRGGPAHVTSDPDEVPSVSFKPFFLATTEWLAAKQTFDAVFGQSREPFWGGGVQVALRSGIYVEIGASHFNKSGQRAFVFNGQTFLLGIPLTATITPVEVTGGYRYRRWPKVIPYAGIGVSRYAYVQTSDFANAADNLDTAHVGYLVVGGAEFRVHRWVGVGVDVQYTRVTGILGSGGISRDLGENNLGGTALRLKVMVGR